MNTIIIAIKYEEPEWEQTWKCIVACGCPVIVVSRDGLGNMAKAYNTAFNQNIEIIKKYKYVWMVSNITFSKDILPDLVNGMDVSGFAGIHPSFKSDHKHLRPLGQNVLKEVSFIEFTSPIVRVDVFEEIQLDEHMPYVGHDLDWGYRVRRAGYKIGVHHGTEVFHTYIRHNNKPTKVTEMRKQLRGLWVGHTYERLKEKYGDDWRKVLEYKYII